MEQGKSNHYPQLFTPMRIGNTVFKNRLVSLPNCLRYKTGDGCITENEMAYLEAKARGGVAMLTLGETPVNLAYTLQDRCSVFDLRSLAAMAGLSEVVLALHAHGCVASIQLNHCGSAALPEKSGGTQPLGPSGFLRRDGVRVGEMTPAQIEAAISDYVTCAVKAMTAGFDMVQLQMGHGWLLYQFLSPLENHRTDQWGGSFENRARLALEVCRRIRARCGKKLLIEARISAVDHLEGGLGLADAVQLLKLLAGSIDLVNVSASHHNNPAVWEWGPTPHVLHEACLNVPYCRAIKEAGITTPLVAVGSISTPEQAEEILASGAADFVGMARALIADPELPNKAKRGAADEIVPCIRCMNCLGSMSWHQALECTVNPEAGRQLRLLHAPKAHRAKRVAVVGGGPGGLQAALTAAENGHQVTLYEKGPQLGGMLRFLEREHLKGDYGRFLRYLTQHVQTLAEVRLNTAPSPQALAMEGYDAVIMAIGGEAITPPVPGLREHALPILNVFDRDLTGVETICIVGGGVAGCELAFDLAEAGHQVTILELLDQLGLEDVEVNHNRVYALPLLFRIQKHPNLHIRTGCRCTGVEAHQVQAVRVSDGSVLTIPAQLTICAAGVRAMADEALAFAHTAPEFYMVGDCRKTARVPEAVHAGYFAALELNQ